MATIMPQRGSQRGQVQTEACKCADVACLQAILLEGFRSSFLRCNRVCELFVAAGTEEKAPKAVLQQICHARAAAAPRYHKQAPGGSRLPAAGIRQASHSWCKDMLSLAVPSHMMLA